jgi:hypothetical protein
LLSKQFELFFIHLESILSLIGLSKRPITVLISTDDVKIKTIAHAEADSVQIVTFKKCLLYFCSKIDQDSCAVSAF